MIRPKFTIITVCYNAEKHIRETIESLLNQTYYDYEYIIKDGLSKDRTLEIVHSLLSGKENVQIISSPDKGIYDAMNQAVKMARGEYVFFLNAGDCFYGKDVLEKTKQFLGQNDSDIAFGDVLCILNKKRELRTYGKICSKKIYFLIGSCICHQAMFAKRILFEEKKFDTNFRVCADREWQLYFLNQGASFRPMLFEVASVLEEGFSKSNVDILEIETQKCLQRYYRNIAWIYSAILKLKKNSVILIIIRELERIIFVKKHDEAKS